jgi:uncharacterized protein YjbJ (UPF0337 family)
MEKEQVTGKVDQLKGKVKQRIGKATNDPDLQDEGSTDRLRGKVKQTYGDVKETIKKSDKMAGTDVHGR